MELDYKSQFNSFKRYYQTLEPKLETPKNKAYTTVIFSILAISLFGWYAIRPTVQTILFLRREIADRSVVSKQMEDKITSLIEAQVSYQEAQPLLPSLNAAIPPTSHVIDLIAQIRTIAESPESSISALQISTVPLSAQEATPGAAKIASKKPFSEFPVTIIYSGPYEAINQFITKLLTMQRVVSIENMNISPAGDSSAQTSGQPVLQVIMKMRSYYTGI